MLTDEQLLAWWRLRRLPRLGNTSLNELRQQLSDPRDLAQLSGEDLVHLGVSAQLAQRWCADASLCQGFEKLQQWRQHSDGGVLLAGVPPYPESLAALTDAPIILYYRGQLEALQQPAVAMVGSRNPSRYGIEWAQQCAGRLAAAGLTVVSGMALGIDGAAHEGAIRQGRSIAVLGCGPDIIYPKRHQSLAYSLLSQGLILSEFAPGTAPRAQQFPSRNRIISGLSGGVVVVEAALRSGSLITAHQAAEQGREVMALPGAVSNPLSQGCHQLIREGATLVQSADDVLQQLGILALQSAPSEVEPGISDQSQPGLVACVDFAPTAVDAIAVRSQLSVAELLPQLLELELAGWLRQSGGGFVRLR